MNPAVSIVVEAYNEEANGLAPPDDTIQALLGQSFPLEQVELILIGSQRQIAEWQRVYPDLPRFQWIKMLPVDAENSHYWQLKNRAAEYAEGEILALIDCDALPGPHWLSSGVAALLEGADASVGPSLYRTEKLASDSPWMMAAALPSWSFGLAITSSPNDLTANALMAHNLIIRRDWLLRHPFQILRRSFVSSLQFFVLRRAGAKFSYTPDQRVAHGVNFRWWLSRMHFRRGWETYEGRRADSSWPRLSALQKLPWIEPVALRMGLVCRDSRHWFRFSRVLGVTRLRAALLFPLAVLASFLARTSEMIGMYAALIAPKATEHQARF
jgi:glycosyltransferase involved in cell wall biosynthesis